ncbi:MAG: glycoside hydrolase family 3 N-terminal domain-containing protein, partial [Opitutus sp.]
MLATSATRSGAASQFPYQDATAPVDARVADLLSRMTLEEKVAQLTSISLRPSAATEEGIAVANRSARERLSLGIGQIENTFDPRPPRQSVELVNKLQRQLRDETRLKIPALIGSECLHGHAGYNSTVFPVPLAMASSWNPELVHRAFDIIGIEARARGAHEAHTPVIDLGRDPRWGRIEESYGEDTYLVTRMAVAVVSGLQGGSNGQPGRTHIISAPKHFAGYGQVSGGRNFAATPIETKTLFDEVLPPFEAAVREAHAQGMMASHCDIGGVPAHGNHWLLTELLKKDWAFPGMVVSDYNDVPRLDEFHHVVGSLDEAAALALTAGMDLDLPVGAGYGRLVGIVKKDSSLLPYLDESVRRILRLKFMLGLFEDPFTDADQVEHIVGQPEHVQLAGQLAGESITLLKNSAGLLPLDVGKLKRIAVIGPRSATKETGGYSMANDHVVSILDGIKHFVGDRAQVEFAEGCKIGEVKQVNQQTVFIPYPLADETAAMDRAVAVAKSAGVAVVCVGGNIQTSMEAFYVRGIKGDRATLDLLGNQNELVRRILATGTPTVVVLMGGKPYAISAIAEQATSILNTFYLGQTNGTALAKVLFGETNPSGKLPVTIPRSVGQLPAYYSQKAESFYKDYLDEQPGPLYPFGFGLSYTTFSYSDLKISKPSGRLIDPVKFSVKVSNSGAVAGAEVVQVYFRDKVASVVRPEKLLVRFGKVFLQPGEQQE